MKNIVINALTAISGGQKTVLVDFINYANRDIQNKYTIFVGSKFDHNVQLNCHINVVVIDSKSFYTRLKWDLFGLNKWCKKNNLNVDFAISLQNTGFRINGLKGIMLHNAIPFKKENWSLLKKNERKFWFLLNFYSVYQKLLISNNDILFVQTEFMKDLVQTKFKRSNIEIINTSRDIFVINETIKNREELIEYFYPADDYIYKNHKLIIDSIVFLRKLGINPNISIKFTLSKNSWVYQYALENNTLEEISFIGSISNEEVMEEYKKSNLLFCSEIESLGLPMIEAMSFQTHIVVFSQPYSIELLREYQNKKIIPYDKNNYDYNVKQLAKEFVHTEKEHVDFFSYVENKLKGEI